VNPFSRGEMKNERDDHDRKIKLGTWHPRLGGGRWLKKGQNSELCGDPRDLKGEKKGGERTLGAGGLECLL